MTTSAPEADEILYCQVHPTVETTLRCNRCGRPMCIRCAVQTPVGYRCKECVRGQQEVFYTAVNADYLIAAGVSVALGFVGGLIASQLGIFFGLILGPVAGSVIANGVRWATRRRRGRYTGYVVAAATLVGGMVGALAAQWPYLQAVLQMQGQPGASPDLLTSTLGSVLLGPLVFVGVAAFVALSWFRYGQ